MMFPETHRKWIWFRCNSGMISDESHRSHPIDRFKLQVGGI
jgi:hypothetical protein